MKRKKISKKKVVSFGSGGNTVNNKFPNARRIHKDNVAKNNIQTMGFNDSIPSR